MEELDGELLLQRTDLLAHRGLADAQEIGCKCETAGPGYCMKGAEPLVVLVHGCFLFLSRRQLVTGRAWPSTLDEERHQGTAQARGGDDHEDK
ncbi:hypothetical protein D3C85_1724220 [compost metagenome]